MTDYSLKDDGYSFKKIMHGKKWVGRVVKHATDPVYLGIIGKITVRMPSETGAFREVAARAMGFNSVDALLQKNAEVRVENRQIRAEAKIVVGEMLRGNFDPLFEKMKSEAAIPRRRN